MTDRESKLVLAALLHDVGKAIFRQADEKSAVSQSGWLFLRDEAGVEDEEILDCVRYHCPAALGASGLRANSLAYIVATANRIATLAQWQEVEEAAPFEMSMPLRSIFGRLHGRDQAMYYTPDVLKEDINNPMEAAERFGETYYIETRKKLTEQLKGMKWGQEDINSLLERLEELFSYFPAGADEEFEDISLYDHLKITAALASCVWGYLEEEGAEDYRERLFDGQDRFDAEDAFLLCSMDVSGIQKFIYTITSENALRTLRARSFYLEIMMEHIIDSLLCELDLSRANLIYSGGGHCYLLLPNTERVRGAVDTYMDQLNHWLMETFDIALYVAWGYAPASANSLRNIPEGSYAGLYRRIGDETGGRKSHRYSAEDIIALNSRQYEDYTSECKVCKRISRVDEDGVCPVCRAIRQFSRSILENKFFAVTRTGEEDALPLPGGYYLKASDERQEKDVVRMYAKNRIGESAATKLWVGDYTARGTFSEYAGEARGIERIGILRADVDNLGQAFVSGFENPVNGNRYVTLERTAALSRQLSLFFKLHINRILKSSDYSIEGENSHPRKATICYSGGDDLFIVGAWDEVVELAMDIKNAFERFTQGALTFSAGIGVYEADYPISAAAEEVARLEEASKRLPGKGAVTIFPDGQSHPVDKGGRLEIRLSDGTYSWREFEERVIGEKYRVLCQFLQTSEGRGKSFLYKLLELIRGREEKINFARYVYLLARLEPDKDAAPEQKQAYGEFSSKMYQWIKNDTDCRQLKTAIYLYAYLWREKEE